MKKLTLKKIQNLLPLRNTKSNKTDGGHVMLVAGAKGFLGAGILASLSATKIGAGYTHLMYDQKSYPWVQFPDFIVYPLKVSELSHKSHYSFGIGSGLGVNHFTLKVIKKLIKENAKKVVLDADALTVISQNKNIQIPPSWILTPHEGELARLLHKTSQWVKNNRVTAIRLAHKIFGCHILLKGSETLLVDDKGEIIVVCEGTVALSKAGMGDVLTGLISALLAQGLTSFDAMRLGTFIHGRVSQEYLKKGNDYLSMRPMDLIDGIPRTLKKLRS